MPRSIIFDFPSIEVTVRAELQEEAEPELCDTLWKGHPGILHFRAPSTAVRR